MPENEKKPLVKQLLEIINKLSQKGIEKNKKNIDIYEEIVVEPDNIPEGAVFVKYYEIEVQDIIFKPHNTTSFHHTFFKKRDI